MVTYKCYGITLIFTPVLLPLPSILLTLWKCINQHRLMEDIHIHICAYIIKHREDKQVHSIVNFKRKGRKYVTNLQVTSLFADV